MDIIDARREVAANVRALMGRGVDGKRVTQTELAPILGLKSQAAVSERLNGRRGFDFDQMMALAAFFDVKVTDLLEGVSHPSDAEDPVAAF